ncbi:V-type ATPase subunit [endosymbiont of Ridgeia piscesae]|jgi:V/A-type H+-transporting ATPase subunit C|uniref:Archaeal/vacuolar-type H+-ATPase subunit C/Vma6 n=1 Tax=endosymbiont of Ridgeia piscesae TaxID=54398 RepID=A0A0T5YWD2_9GAMM|nr:V-type ATPase subunit [endosymbiont of Ridgeia piscesae]KRT54904.1 Archaeal/vacuolar-type H+-ATPase subunit C/Vma6 [endosymbiont of Ridgeia piscesae]KRT60031.1 V/A-type H+-transporting ATPase subunit C [endosymbiont of Ridgeia piscesae]
MQTATQTYLKTRVSILASRLLDPEQAAELIDLTAEELDQRLALNGILSQNLRTQQLNRTLEHSLINNLMLELAVLTRPLTGSARTLLLFWSRKFELFNLKALIRSKLKGLPIEQIQETLHQLPESISLPHEALLQTENIREMLRLLEHGPYAPIAHQARQVYAEKNEPFSLDAAIDRSYFSGLVHQAQRTEPLHRDSLRPLIGSLIDRQNILWLFRYRFSYRLSPSETYYLLIPAGRQIGRQQLMQLANLSSFGEIIENLPARIRALLAESINPMQVRQQLDRQMSTEAQRLIRFSPSVLTRALAYLVARHFDLERLQAILQGRALGLNGDLIRQAIGVPPLATRQETLS